MPNLAWYPVPLATVRVVGTSQSILANDLGEYRIRLKSGPHQLRFSHVAHYSQELSVAVSDSTVTQDVYLDQNIIQLKGIRVFDQAIDPAQEIILNAIANKTDILSRLQDYRFDAYTRIVIKKIKENDSTEYWLIAESQIEAFWEQPDKYKEVITARKQSANIEPDDNLIALGEIIDFNRNRCIYIVRVYQSMPITLT